MQINIPYFGDYTIERNAGKPKSKSISIPTDDGKVLPISSGRSSEPDVPTSLLSIIMKEQAIIPPEFQIDLIKVLENLARYNSDVSYAVENIVQLGNTDYDISFNEDMSKTEAIEARKEINLVEANWYGYSGGLKSLRNDLLAQAAISGAVSGEIVPNNNLDGVKKLVLVSPKNIRFSYDGVADIYEPYQVLTNNIFGNRNYNATPNGLIRLNSTTYKYYAVRRFNESPYAIPPFLSALESIIIEKDMLDNFKNVIKKLGILGFMDVLIKLPAKLPTEDQVTYDQRAMQVLETSAREMDKGVKKGLVVGFDGMHKFNMTSTTSNITGATDLFKLITELKMAGLKQDPLMLGRNYSTTETVGRVVLAKLSAQLANYQMLVDKFLGEAMYMHLLLKGFNIKTVTVTSRKPILSDESKDMDAFQKKIDAYDALYSQGVIDQTQRAQALGFEKAAEEEPRASTSININAPTDPAAKTKTKPEPDGAKSDPTDTQDPKDEELIKPSKVIIDALAKEKQKVLYVSLQTKNKAYAKVPVFNGSLVARNKFKAEDIISFSIPKNQVVNELADLEFLIRGKRKTFDYGLKHNCNTQSIWNLAGAPKGRRDKTYKKFFTAYTGVVKKQYSAAVAVIVSKVAADLSELPETATLQEVQDSVLTTIYRSWKKTFADKNAGFINEFVKESYTFFHNDKASFFKDPNNVPKIDLNLKDFKTIDYYKDSDKLYLGRFITDEDTKARVTNFIKEKYLDESLPNNNPDVAADFKTEFGDTLVAEDWKIDRIVNTTLNGMRNTAAVNYMNEAGVETFTVIDVNDDLECDYCAEMGGRTFSVSKAIQQVDSLISSDPDEVDDRSPFLTSYSVDDVSNMSDADLQDAGFDLPSYHPNCRCTIQADFDTPNPDA